MYERDFFRQPFSGDELRSLLADTSPADAFAWNSPRARTMGLSRQTPPTDDELLRLMLETPYLLRRPVIRIGGRTFFGFNPREIEQAVR